MNGLKKNIDQIVKDHVSGSSEICNQLISAFKVDTSSPAEIIRLADSLKSKFSHFPVVLHFLNYISSHYKNSKELKAAILKYEEEWGIVDRKVAQNFTDHISLNNKCVLLHSKSGTVLTLFDFLQEYNVKVDIYQTESRPQLEGQLQAKRLVEWGYSIHFFTDALAAQYVESVDMVILGADAILSDDIVNKTGSLGICIAARHFNKPVYVLTDSRKIIDQYLIQSAASEEIWKTRSDRVTVINKYFEKVPKSLVTEIITN